MNRAIRRKLMKAEHQPGTMEQWYERATALDRNWRESRREEERLRGQREQRGTAPRQQEQKQTMPWPLVWQRRQMPSQQATTEPAPIERVERTNMIMVQLQQRTGLAQRNPYAMEVDRGRNCYTCGGFGHMAHRCRNRGRERIEQRRRVEYERGRFKRNHEQLDNLKGEESLESLD